MLDRHWTSPHIVPARDVHHHVPPHVLPDVLEAPDDGRRDGGTGGVRVQVLVGGLESCGELPLPPSPLSSRN